MSWIKRNLFFVIGSLIALGLLGYAGFYSYTRWKLNVDTKDQINAQYEELNRLNNLNPHPGKDKVDNIAAAREQRGVLTNVIVRATKQFQPIPTIPASENVTNITSEEFASALRRTIDQLQRDAANASVNLPPRYSFSFEAQRQLVKFSGNLGALAVQLGEVKAICDVFNNAKVNSLDAIRRERVAADDLSGPPTDYTELHSETNELAVLSPYEVSFRSFSPELADVLAQFASSPNGFIVKSITVEPAPTVTVGDASASGAAPGTYLRQPVAPVAPTRGGLQTFITERQLRISMVIEIVKLLPKQ